MSDKEKLPSQEKNSEKIPLARMEQLEDELEEGADILKKEGLLIKGIEEEEEEEEDQEKESEDASGDNSSDEGLPERPTFNKHTSVKHWENKAEKRYEFTRDQVADMIDGGASDEEIWEAAQEAGVFFKYDGSSYYLSDDSKEDSDKYQWRRRSANDNTSGGYRQEKMLDHIKRELGKYRDLKDTYGDLDEVFAAADALHSAGEKPTLNKMYSMQPYWEDIKVTSPESPAAPTEKSEASKDEPEAEAPQESAESKEPKSAEKADAAEEAVAPEKPESDQEEKEEVDIPKGTPVYLHGGEGGKGPRRWEEPKPLKSIHKVNGVPYVEVEGSDDLYKLEKIEPADKEDTPSLNEEVVEGFEDQFNISPEELSEIPGFTDLTEGQQKLALENFRKMTVGRIEEEGVKEYREDLENSGTFSRLWKGFLSSHYKAEAKSEAGKELLSGGIDVHRSALVDIVEKTKESGLDLDGDDQIKFVPEGSFDDLSPENAEVLESFNEAAQAFSRLSDNWRYEDVITENISGSTREEFQTKREEYRKALRDYIDLARDKKGEAGVKEAMEMDKKVRFTQFFSGDEDYEKALQQIKDEPKWWRRPFDNVVAEKGSYMALGYSSRALSFGTLGTVAAPLAVLFSAAGLGAYRARSKAIESLEDEALVRKGGGDATVSRNAGGGFATIGKAENQAEVINTVPAEQLTSKLRQLLNKLDNPDLDEEEREDIEAQLSRRVQYTTQKIEGGTYVDEETGKEHEYAGGLVDYGEADGRAGRRYDLLQTLSEAQALDLLNNDTDIQDDISGRLDRYLNYKDEKTRRYVTEKSTKGAVYSAGFAGLGMAIADFFSGGEAGTEIGDIDHSGDKDIIDSDSPEIKPDQPEAESIITHPEAPEEVPTPPEELGSQEFVIDESGEGMIHAIADKLEAEYEISHKKAMEIGNKLFMEGEQLKGDHEMFNLVHEGDSFSINFGDLTEEDLQNLSTDELVETIEFDQDDFTSGGDLKPQEELPETSNADTEGYKDIPFDRIDEVDVPSASTTGGSLYGGHNPVEGVDQVDVPDAGNLSEQDVENWQQELEDEGIIVKDTPDADVSAEGEPAGLEGGAEAVSGSVTPEQVNQLPSSEMASYAHHAWTYASEGHNYMDVPAENLRHLQQILRRDMSAGAAENILRLKEDPELLTSLERVLTGATESGLDRYGEEASDALTFVREHVSQLDADDFGGDIPEYAQQSLEDSRDTVNQLPSN